MKVVKLDDYQSWRVDIAGLRVLIDPWLTMEMKYAFGLASRVRTFAPAEKEFQADLLIVTAEFGDHLHPPSLAKLPSNIPTWSTHTGCKQLRSLGFTSVQVAKAGHTIQLGAADQNASLQFVAPGFPYSTNALGLVFQEGSKRAYLEAHVTTAARLQKIGPVDVMVSTAEGVRMFGIQLSMDVSRAAQAAAQSGSRIYAPTGLSPQMTRGLLPSLLSIRSDPDALQSELQRRGSSAQARWLKPGEALEV